MNLIVSVESEIYKSSSSMPSIQQSSALLQSVSLLPPDNHHGVLKSISGIGIGILPGPAACSGKDHRGTRGKYPKHVIIIMRSNPRLLWLMKDLTKMEIPVLTLLHLDLETEEWESQQPLETPTPEQLTTYTSTPDIPPPIVSGLVEGFTTPNTTGFLLDPTGTDATVATSMDWSNITTWTMDMDMDYLTLWDYN